MDLINELVRSFSACNSFSEPGIFLCRDILYSFLDGEIINFRRMLFIGLNSTRNPRLLSFIPYHGVVGIIHIYGIPTAKGISDHISISGISYSNILCRITGTNCL